MVGRRGEAPLDPPYKTPRAAPTQSPYPNTMSNLAASSPAFDSLSGSNATVRVGRDPEGIVVLPDQSKAYVTNWFSGDVSVIDIAAAREVKRIKCAAGPRAIALGAGVP